MSHPDQLHLVGLVRASLPQCFTSQRVLEVGSLDINGSVRTCFDDCDYVGIDVGPGPGVDLVVPGQDYAADDASFDVVISAECMEHNPEWAATASNMLRLLRPGGLFLLTCAAPGRAEHGTTRTSPGTSPLTVGLGQEHYRNLTHRDFAKVPGLFEGLSQYAHWINWASNDLYLVGVKGGDTPEAWPDLVSSITAWVAARSTSDPRARRSKAAFSVGGARAVETYLTASILWFVARSRLRGGAG